MIRAVASVAVMLLSVDAAAQAPPRPGRDVFAELQPTGTAIIVGRVTAAESGIPLRQAIVAAVHSVGFPREVMTDDNGRFEFSDLQAGAWQLTVTRPGYIPRKYGQTRPFGRASTVDVRPGQQVAVEIPLTRASAIAGRVRDEYGEPVTAARVTVLRPRMVRQRRYLEPVGESDQTDDTGAFRVHSLPPGEYFVTVSARVAPPDSVVQTTFAPTYYPGTADFSAAQKVRVARGADAFVDLPLLPVRPARVSGVVIASNGRPADAFLSLTSEGGELGTQPGFGGATREDGGFAIADIPPGNYTLVAEIRSGPTAASEVGAVTVIVDGNDVNVTVTTAKPGSLRGSIVADTGVRRRLPDMLDISARPRRPGAVGTFTTTTENSFEMPAPPGPFTIEVEPPDGWAVKSVTLGGFDAYELAIDIGNEQNVPVNVVLTDRVTEVSGTVAGVSEAGAAVVIFPADVVEWTPRRVQSARTDARGRFRILGLPPGDRYLAVAVDDIEEGQEQDPDFLRQLQNDGAPFSLGVDEKRIIELKILQP